MINSTKLLIATVFLLTITENTSFVYSQKANQDIVEGIPVNYDEALSGTYTLPDPLVLPNGKKIKNARQGTKREGHRLLHCLRSFSTGRFR